MLCAEVCISHLSKAEQKMEAVMKLAEMKSRGQCAKSGFLHSIYIIPVLQNVHLMYSKDFWPNIIQIADIVFHPYHQQEN